MRRIVGALFISALIFILPGGASGLAAQESTVTSTIAGADRAGPWGDSSYDFSLKVSKSIFKTVNLLRTKKGLSPFTADSSLGLVAGSYAGDMLSGDFFGHFAPDGRGLKDRFLEANVTHFREVAENLWTAEGEITWEYKHIVRQAVTDWMNSREGHREAMLDPNFTSTAVGTAIRDGRIVVAMLFGRR